MVKYFPYLRGKTFELSAIEHAIPTLKTSGKMMPIVEPVRVKSSLVSKAKKLAKANVPLGLVMNPQVGELAGASAATPPLLGAMRATGANVVPVLIVHNQLQGAEVQQFQAHVTSGGQSVYVHFDLPSSAVVTALMKHAPSVNLFVDGATGSTHQASFPNRALLRDGFRAQSKNASYPPQSFFSDLHLTYAGSGYIGFGDFAAIGDRYTEGGGPAYAVAIHLTEDQSTHGVVCNHFVSTSNATTANTPGKFSQAVGALAAYVRANPGKIDFSTACQELLAHHANGTWGGLGDLKRISIQHHLELMAALV